VFSEFTGMAILDPSHVENILKSKIFVKIMERLRHCLMTQLKDVSDSRNRQVNE
jgi:hypothetical protein